MSQRSVLLNPGPVTLTDRVRAALNRGDWCHREPEFAQLTREINRELASIYAGTAEGYDSVILTGSGTAAVEGMLASFAPTDSTTLVMANGVYGERMAAILDAQHKPHILLRQEWTAALDIDGLRNELDRHPDVTHLATVHHETTTGRLNDLDAVGRICAERGIALLLDAVSSFGGEEIDAAGWNLEAVAATANKCLHGVPGMALVLARKAAWQREPQRPQSVYLNLHSYHRGQHGDGYSPFTQSVQVAFALREALAELAESGGWRARRESYRQRAEFIYRELTEEKVSILLNKNEYSSVLWSYVLPEGVTYTALHDRLKAEGFVIYAGQGQLGPRIFRLAHMGDIRDDDLAALCRLLRRTVRGLRA
jgi:2-aminoethylphosphonate-pyruvate transaminase